MSSNEDAAGARPPPPQPQNADSSKSHQVPSSSRRPNVSNSQRRIQQWVNDTPLPKQKRSIAPPESYPAPDFPPLPVQYIDDGKAAEVPLPPSETSTSGQIADYGTLTRGSLDQLCPENVRLPSSRSSSPESDARAGLPPPRGLTLSKRQNDRKQGNRSVSRRHRLRASVPPPPPPPPIHLDSVTAPKVELLAGYDRKEYYRGQIKRLARYIPNLKAFSKSTCRHDYAGRLVVYEYQRDTNKPILIFDEDLQTWLPTRHELAKAIGSETGTSSRRLIIAEDLSDDMVEFLGQALGISPRVFADHLDRSGYTKALDDSQPLGSWDNVPVVPSHTSFGWFRPVLPHRAWAPRLRNALIERRFPSYLCQTSGCPTPKHPVSTKGNILRKHWRMSPFPNRQTSSDRSDFPVGWAEKATVHTTKIGQCTYTTLFLDPLPQLASLTGRSDRKTAEDGIAEVVVLPVPSRPAPQSRREPPPPPPPPPVPPPFNPDETEQPLAVGTPPDAVQVVQSTSMAPTRPLQRQALRHRPQQVPRQPDQPADSHDSGSVNASSRGQPGRAGMQPLVNFTRQPRKGIRVQRGTEQNLADNHPPFCPFDQFMMRGPTEINEDELLRGGQIELMVNQMRNPKSTFEETKQWRLNDTEDPLHILIRVIHSDIVNLLNITQTTVERIKECTSNDALVQEHVQYWRSLLNLYQKHLADMKSQLPEFVKFIFMGPQTSRTDFEQFKYSIPGEYRGLIEDALRRLSEMNRVIATTNDNLRAEMQIIDSRRSIAEAESVSKLTELAFVFIPLTFATSLFSVQARELNDGVPLYVVFVVCISLITLAYCVRLLIRSGPVVRFKRSVFHDAREQAGLHDMAPLPTRDMLRYVVPVASHAVLGGVKEALKIAALSTPFVLTCAGIAALLSPIVLLWHRNMDHGFSAVMTLLFLLTDGIIIYPIALEVSKSETVAEGLSRWWHYVATPEGRMKAPWRSDRKTTRRKRRRIGDEEIMVDEFVVRTYEDEDDHTATEENASEDESQSTSEA